MNRCAWSCRPQPKWCYLELDVFGATVTTGAGAGAGVGAAATGAGATTGT